MARAHVDDGPNGRQQRVRTPRVGAHLGQQEVGEGDGLAAHSRRGDEVDVLDRHPRHAGGLGQTGPGRFRLVEARGHRDPRGDAAVAKDDDRYAVAWSDMTKPLQQRAERC